MEILIITDSGCEEACALEIGRYMKAKPVLHRNVLSLQGSLDEAITLAYRLQTARRVLLQLAKLSDLEDLEHATPGESIVQLLPSDASFKVEGDVLALSVEKPDAAPLLMNQELVESVGGWAARSLPLRVKLNKPDFVIYAAHTPEQLVIGLDLVGRSLARRDWRIMLSRRSLKSTVAAATVIYSGAKDTDLILDPFADDGSIVTEAALLLSHTSPRLFDRDMSFERLEQRDWMQWRKEGKRDIQKILAFSANLQEIKAIRTNSKLAGVDKEIHSTKVAVDWVDAKIDERSIDRIITAPMPSGKSVAPSQVAKLNEQLFYQAAYVLKRGKTLTCVTEKPDELLPAAEKHGFKQSERRKILMGKRQMGIISFKK